MTYRKKLIEVALPLEAINVASAREKSIRHGHPSTLHLWWARRPLAACRAVIFTSLVDDPDDPESSGAFIEACQALPKGRNAADHDTPRQRLFDFIERLVTWEATTDEEILGTARELIRLCTDGTPPPLLDPFAGGGSIPLEAQRLGLEAHASDLNPVAVMINKALIEIPPRFANRPPVNPRDREGTGGGGSWKGAAGLAADVRYYGEWMRDRALERIGHLYPTCNGETVIAWLWARTVKCPNPACGAQMPLVSSFELSKKKGRRAWVEPQIDLQTKQVRFEVRTGRGKPPDPPKVGRGAKFRCLVCGEVAPDQHIKDEGMAGRMGAQLMAIVTEGRHGRNYHAPTDEHEAIAREAQPSWQPVGELADDPRAIWCKLYGLIEFADLFTPRQLVALTTFSDLVAEAREQVRADALAAGLAEDDVPLGEGGSDARAYSEAIGVYAATVVSKATVASNSLARWRPGESKTAPAFGRQAIPMVWDFAETNPFAGAGGDFFGIAAGTANALERLPAGPAGSAQLLDAAGGMATPEPVVLSTDPPYYDNIGYADLSDFSYVWLRPMLMRTFPHEFSTLLAPKEQELVATPYRFDGNRQSAEAHFETGLTKAFAHMRHISRPDLPFTVYYAFKQSEIVVEDGTASTGWETILSALVDTGFCVVGTWPMRTEGAGRLVAAGTNALASSIVLVCRPRAEDAPSTSRREFVRALRAELPAALREMQTGNIAPVDLAQATIGPGMAVYSRYGAVLEANGERLGVRAALQIINAELDAYLAEVEGHSDSDTRFALAWFEQFGFKEGPFGQADVLARAKNTAIDGLVYAGILESGAGIVRLIPWRDLDPGWDPTTDKRLTVWEAVHHLVERLNTHGEEGAALLLARMPADLAADARQLAYRLYSICERKNWAEHALDYNALVVSWRESQERASALREQYQQSSLGL